jgi:pyruvate-formate lyase
MAVDAPVSPLMTIVRPADVPALNAIGEHYAAGFYEALFEGQPQWVWFGRAIRNMYERMPINAPDDVLLLPSEPVGGAMDMEHDGYWHALGSMVSWSHSAGVGCASQLAGPLKKRHPDHADMIDRLAAEWASPLRRYGFAGYTHSNPDFRRVIAEGLVGLEAELADEHDRARAASEPDVKRLELYAALKDYTAGVRAFHRRVVEAAEQRKALEPMLPHLRRSLVEPARTFYEGMLTTNWLFMLDMHDGLGHIDQYLIDLYRQDVANGEITEDLAFDLLCDMWRKFERFNGWNIQIGGTSPDGEMVANELTTLCIRVDAHVNRRRPNLALRIRPDTPHEVMVEAMRTIATGTGKPALYNDDAYIPALMDSDLGLTLEDAREYGFGGCTEIMIPGLSNCGSLEAYLNFAKSLELALWDGRDPLSGRQEGPHTGRFVDMRSFDQFYTAVKRQMDYATLQFVGWANAELERRFDEGDPHLARTLFTRDCVSNGRHFDAGGARYNWSVVSYHGLANAADSLAVVKKLVFEDRVATPQQLLDALAADWESHEDLLHQVKSVPRFGNGAAYVDSLAADYAREAWELLRRFETPRGGRYLPSCILFVTYEGAGLSVAATPDGRRSREVLTDSIGPAQGRDADGPTSMMRSVAGLPLDLAVGTPVLNIRFLKSVLDNPTSRDKVIQLVRSFFRMGGLQIQVTVIDKERMLDAQREPEKHQDLIVRIGGYSEYFCRLSPGLQDSVIARTEHGV